MSKHYNFAYYVSAKRRSIEFGKMLARGARFHYDIVELVSQETPDTGFDGAIKLGLSRAASRVRDIYLEAGKHFIFCDKGYTKAGYWRASVDAWQPLAYFQRFKRPADRWRATGPRLKRRRKVDVDNAAVVLAGSCQNYSNFCKLGDVNDYNLVLLQKLREHTDRTIIYRPNPSWYLKHHDEFRPVHEEVKDVRLSEPAEPFMSLLENCQLLVANGSSVSVSALAFGVPTMVLLGGVAKNLALKDDDFDKIEDPYWPKDTIREQFFSDLAYCQWTSEELMSGEAWGEIRLALASLEQDYLHVTPGEILNQYKLMHKHEDYFRGRTTLKYADEIGAFLRHHTVHTLLDYGSGKGEQYEDPYRLQDEWGVSSVTCYDPGVLKFDDPPRAGETFGAVICCDVMEHVPEEAVQPTLQEILRYAEKCVFFGIATTPATKTLPNGQNCHVTVRPEEWWQKQIAQASKVCKRPIDIVLRVLEGDQ